MTQAPASHHPLDVPLELLQGRLVSRKTGVLKGLNRLYRAAAEPRAHVAVSELTDSSFYADCGREASGTGVGLLGDRALMSALGEAVEGYCAYDIRQDLLFGSYQEITEKGLSAVSPAELPLYSETQYLKEGFRFRPFTEDAPVRWFRGTSAITGKERLLPAALVYVSYQPCAGETPLCHTIFGGIASGISYDAAMLSGLYEAVERDAMMIWWLGQLPLPRLRPEKGSWLDEAFHKYFSAPGLSFELWHISLDIPVPVFFGLVTDEKNQAVAGGFGTNLNPGVAALKALFECVQNRLGQLPMKHEWGRELFNAKSRKNVFAGSEEASTGSFGRMTDLNNNLHVYLRPEARRFLDAVRSGQKEICLEDIPNFSKGSAGEDLRTCLEILKNRNFDVMVSDLTHEDVAEAGFVVMRVSVPGLVPNSVTAWPHLGNTRLYRVPQELGFTLKTEADLADFPMPYA